jgi:sortase A
VRLALAFRPSVSRFDRARLLAASLLLLLGGCLAARSVYLRGKAVVAGLLVRGAWAHTLESGERTPPWPRADTHPIARLRIPRLGYDEIVLSDASPRNLAFGPAHLALSPAPGEPGNVVLAGHRTSWFEPLARVRAGDVVRLEWRDATRAAARVRDYRVVEMRVVDPRDTAHLAPTDTDALTLVTCYPFGRGPRSPLRYVLRAVPSMDLS